MGRSLRFAWAALLLVVGAAHAEVVTIGGAAIQLPAPAGFANPAVAAPALGEALASFVAPSNQQLASFVTPRDVQAVQQGQQPRLERYFGAQTLRQLAGSALTRNDFTAMRKVLREQNAEVLRRAGPDADRQLEAVLQALQQGAPSQAAASLERHGTLAVDIYRDSEEAFGLMLLMNFEVEEAGGKPRRRLVLGGLVTTVVRGKLLYLYTYSDFRTTRDLHWVRKHSLAWLKAVHAANP